MTDQDDNGATLLPLGVHDYSVAPALSIARDICRRHGVVIGMPRSGEHPMVLYLAPVIRSLLSSTAEGAVQAKMDELCRRGVELSLIDLVQKVLDEFNAVSGREREALSHIASC
jgi:hypothetical protein